MSDFNWGNIGTVPQNQVNWATTTREPNQDLDRQAFLNLLITQLRHQDPLNPMDDRDFIAQMAQFSALEQMMNLNATFERTQAFNMIGKVIDASFMCPTANERIEVEGALVTSVVRNGQRVYLTVAGEPDAYGRRRQIDVPFDSVRVVSEDFFLALQLSEIHSQIQGQRATDLVGQNVQGFARFGDGSMEFVEGKVHSISMQGDMVIVHVGSNELVFPQDVVSVVTPERKLIGSTVFTHGDEVVGLDVVIRNNRPYLYLLFCNDSRIRVAHFNHLTAAMNYVGDPNDPRTPRITSGSAVDAIVESITIRAGGLPFLNARNADGTLVQVDFTAYLAERGGVENDDDSTETDSSTSDSNSDGDDE